MKKYRRHVIAILILGICYAGYSYYPSLQIVTGFASKSMTSGMYIAGRSQESIENGDNGFFPIRLAKSKVVEGEKSISSALFGLEKRKSIFIEGRGAILVNEGFDSTKQFRVPNRRINSINKPYPYGNLEPKDTLFEEVDYVQLQKAVDNAFDRPEENRKKTRSVLVVYKDRILAEKYADGFDKTTPILGWSMTKSMVSTMYGILEKKGKIDIYEPAKIDAWVKDDRKHITYNDLLHMNSGLEWEESYTGISDATKMLYLESDMGRVQLEKPLVGKPNETWNYSSGTTNLLGGPLLRQEFSSHQAYLDFWYRELLDKIGMHSALIETDLQGNYVASSYGWANTRDWAKFGLLYLHEGNWDGEQILDSSWVKYVATPTNSSEGRYGAQFWLNAGGFYPDVPRDLYSCNGYQGQYIFIIPSTGLTIVRMGLTEDPKFNVNEFLKDIIASIN